MSFNPHSPSALGVEWRPIHEPRFPLSSALEPMGAKLASSATETVDAVWLAAMTAVGNNAEAYVVEVYQDGVFPSSTVTTVTAYPSMCPGQIGAQAWDGSSLSENQSTFHSFVNNVTQTPVTMYGTGLPIDDDLLFNSLGLQWFAGFTYDGLAAALSGKHIISVRQEARVQPVSAIGDLQSMTVQPYMICNGAGANRIGVYFGPMQTVAGQVPGGHVITHDWFTNPAQFRVWLPQDLDEFDSGVNTSALGWFFRPTGSAQVYAVMFQTNVQVRHAGNDLREALGHITVDRQIAGEVSGHPGWFNVPMYLPDGTAGWSKASGTDYRLTFTRYSGGSGGIRIDEQTLSGVDGPGAYTNGWSRLDVKNRPDTRIPYAASDPVDGLSWAPSIALEVSGASSVDSQPYVNLELQALVYTGVEQRQYFTTPGTLPDPDFYLVRALVGRVGETASGPLSIEVRRVSGDVLMGSTVTLTSDDFDDLEDVGTQTAFANYKTAMLRMASPATLATSTQYYFKITSTATTAETGWRVESLQATAEVGTDTPPPSINNVTFGGSTNGVQYNGDSFPQSDICLVLLTLPGTPASFGAAPGASGCERWAQLTWSATALGADFSYYEIQRNSGDKWYTIARVTDEDVTSWQDRESHRGRPNSWRMRVVRVDTAVSDWTATATTTVAVGCCGYELTSNEAPSLTVWYDDVAGDGGERQTDLPQNIKVQQFQYRDFQVGFHELEDRGATFKRTLVVAVDGAHDDTESTLVPGLRTYDDLLAICRPSRGGTLSYVCVHEETGDRWFATIKTPSVTRRASGNIHLADVEIIEVTNVPSVVTVTE